LVRAIADDFDGDLDDEYEVVELWWMKMVDNCLMTMVGGRW